MKRRVITPSAESRAPEPPLTMLWLSFCIHVLGWERLLVRGNEWARGEEFSYQQGPLAAGGVEKLLDLG